MKQRLVFGGSVEKTFTHADGSVRTDGKPSRVVYRADGSVETEEWWDGIDHEGRSDDLPAAISYHPDGSLRYRQWYANGVMHRDRGPALIEQDEAGEITTVDYFRNGNRHRLEGPAVSMPFLRYTGHYLHGKDYPSRAELLAAFADWDDEAIRKELEASDYDDVIAEGIEPRAIVDALVAGITTSEGIREVVNGSPAEWVRAYEEGSK